MFVIIQRLYKRGSSPPNSTLRANAPLPLSLFIIAASRGGLRSFPCRLKCQSIASNTMHFIVEWAKSIPGPTGHLMKVHCAKRGWCTHRFQHVHTHTHNHTVPSDIRLLPVLSNSHNTNNKPYFTDQIITHRAVIHCPFTFFCSWQLKSSGNIVVLQRRLGLLSSREQKRKQIKKSNHLFNIFLSGNDMQRLPSRQNCHS